MRTAFAIAASLFCACAHDRFVKDPALVRWQSDHADAAGELCTYAKYEVSPANRLREWARDHPMQAQQLLQWAATDPGQMNIPPSLLSSPGFSRYRASRDPAMASLIGWAAEHPEAAKNLTALPHGLEQALDVRSC